MKSALTSTPTFGTQHMTNPGRSSSAYRWVILLFVVGLAIIGWWLYKPTTAPFVAPAPSTGIAMKSDISQAGSTTKAIGISLPISTAWPALPGVKTQAPAANFAEALKAYNPDEQKYLKHFNDLTHGLLDFSSPEDQQWKLARGYPTIEEILANRGKPVPLEGKFYREALLKEAVMAALRVGEAIQEAKGSDDLGPTFPKPASGVLYLVSQRVGEENPQSAALAGYLHVLSVSPYQKDGASLIGGAALAAQMGDPLLAHRLNRDPVVNEEQGRFGVPGILQSIYGNGIAVRRWQTEAGVYNGRPFAID